MLSELCTHYSVFVKSSLMQPLALSVDKEKQQRGENSHVDGGDAVEQPRQATNHGETMNDPPGGLTEHQSNEALLALHSSSLSSSLQTTILRFTKRIPLCHKDAMNESLFCMHC